VRKCLALKSAKRIYPSDLNTSHIGLTELTSLVHKSEGATWSLKDIPKELFPDLHEHLTPIDNYRATHVTAIQETA
jgi:hypothetical protein